jgi:hypothetical protein
LKFIFCFKQLDAVPVAAVQRNQTRSYRPISNPPVHFGILITIMATAVKSVTTHSFQSQIRQHPVGRNCIRPLCLFLLKENLKHFVTGAVAQRKGKFTLRGHSELMDKLGRGSVCEENEVITPVIK